MDIEEFEIGIDSLLHPEPDGDGFFPREFPNDRLRNLYDLKFNYMEDMIWEGSSGHRYTRSSPADANNLHALTVNFDIASRLFASGFHLYRDSVIAYHEKTERKGDIRFYPPIILTFWSGFETYVRYSSELLLETVPTIPNEVKLFLQEKEKLLDKNGAIKEKARYQPVLDRYFIFLKYAYNFTPDRGTKFWQRLVKAKVIRDYYTHLDVRTARAISANDILDYMEALLLGIIWPSSMLQRTLMLGVYYLYDIWTFLYDHKEEYVERPFFMDWRLHEGYLFHCNFENVDTKRFPNDDERRLHHHPKNNVDKN